MKGGRRFDGNYSALAKRILRNTEITVTSSL
jgi:type IV secretory pathway VirJ component